MDIEDITAEDMFKYALGQLELMNLSLAKIYDVMMHNLVAVSAERAAKVHADHQKGIVSMSAPIPPETSDEDLTD